MTHSLRLIIELHLTMAQVSQQRDLEDPAVIRRWPHRFKRWKTSRMLTLHSFADAQATSNKLWNGFKDTLLWQLYNKALTVLKGGTDFVHAEEMQRKLLEEETLRILPRSFSPTKSRPTSTVCRRAISRSIQRGIVTDLTLTHRFMHHQLAEEDKALEPVSPAQRARPRYTACKVCTWDRAGSSAKSPAPSAPRD